MNVNIETKRIIKEKTAGTLLDGRYEINGMIGKGGFSVVYDAINKHTGQHVAIKECTLQESTDRFLRESRILHDFSEEPSIVSVFDSFEENGTAYIVMEYLDGITLREHVKDAGKYPAEEVVRLFSPVMQTLIHLHEAGVIHRDISPDNIMLMKDGSLKLLDFGAAQNFRDSKVSSLVFKSSYSPPEQMDDKGELGPYTDVYALCATMYFCLTGTDPDDVMSRLLLDELKLPSALGSDIMPQAEKTLMKGLKLDGKKRTQNVKALQEELEAVYPVLTEEEKLLIAKRKKRQKIIAVAASAVMIIVLIILVNAHKTEIILRMAKTYSIVLDGCKMTDEEFAHASNDVRERVDALTSGIYTWDTANKYIECKIPYSCIGGAYLNSEDYAVYLLTRPLVLHFIVPDGEMSVNSTYLFEDKLSQREDILSTERKGNVTTIRFSPEAKERLKDYLSHKNKKVYLAYDIEYTPFAYTEAVTVGDGETITVDHSEDIIKDTEDFERLRLTKEPFKGFFEEKQFLGNEDRPDEMAEWEDSESTMFSGVYQTDTEDEVFDDGPALYLKYDLKSEDDEILINLHDYPISAQTVIKSRLEHMSKPYALGIDKYYYWMVWVKISAADCWQEMIELLGETALPPEIGSRSAVVGGKGSLEAPVFLKEDDLDPVGLECKIDSKDVSSINAILQKIKNTDENVYLFVNEIPVAYTSVSSALKSVDNEGRIIFNYWNSPVADKFDWSSYSMAEFIEGLYRQSPIESYKLREDGIYYVDQNGNLTHAEPLDAFFMPMK